MSKQNIEEQTRRDRLQNTLYDVKQDLDFGVGEAYSSKYDFLGDDIKTNIGLAFDNITSAIKKLEKL